MLEHMKVAIFDMDGTLLDSMGAWRELNCSFVREHGIELTAEQEADLYSMTGRMVVDYMQEQFGVKADFPALMDRAVERMKQVYQEGLPLKPGARAYLERLKARGVKRVLCTATPSKVALIALNRSDLVRDLDLIYCTDMLDGHKGEPAFFDKLCAQLSVDKEDCVMFEDACYAMEGAKRAGLGVIGVTDATNKTERETMDKLCDRVIDNYDELA